MEQTNHQTAAPTCPIPIEVAFKWFREQRDRMTEDQIEASLRFFPFALVQELGMLPEVTAVPYDADVLPWTEEALRAYIAGVTSTLPAAILEHRRVRIARLISRAIPPLLFLGQNDLAERCLRWNSHPILGAPVVLAVATYIGGPQEALPVPFQRMAAGNQCHEGCEMCEQAKPSQRA
jgi:hypothetical protein